MIFKVKEENLVMKSVLLSSNLFLKSGNLYEI